MPTNYMTHNLNIFASHNIPRKHKIHKQE